MERSQQPEPLLLSETDLADLTGAQRASAQVRWLQERHWTFELTIAGRPRVARAEFDAQMCTGAGRPEANLGPNLAALDQVG